MFHNPRLDTARAIPVPSDLPREVAGTLPTVQVLTHAVADATVDQAVDALLQRPCKRVFFLNAHCANVAARDPLYASALRRADHILPDGIGIELAARLRGNRLTANLNGTDFIPALLREAARRGLSVFLFGARPGTAERAADRLIRDIPGLRVLGTMDGYDDAQDEEAAIARINASGADILLVAMGVPQQELWIDRNAERLNTRLNLGVGALFDFLAGNVRRAPAIVRKARMEWAWRLAVEPRRMAGRYLIGNFTFMARAIGQLVPRSRVTDLVKRTLDIALAGAGLMALSPLFALIALAIRLDSPGPVFFTQRRVGKNGCAFRMYKFRSMHVDAEARRAQLLDNSDREGVCFKARNDPRVTRVGRILRRTSLDELPQLINVLLGHMSMVGPRPALPEEVAAYPARALERLSVRPGLTGLWQVSGRADIGFDKMIDMDVAYANSRSTLLDLLLIAMTFRVVLTGHGAY
ncbi:exopolysaccharide biosynthesis WecB/TagA/CpsF family protein [Albidovulum inexpectatum]|uniref:Exopolysaccharide biosynthesis WecB/TagA/CpsF family protein n=1 Tax=Albidovulum inexpectatum TaxID=196587 RepID=A0A2S5JGV2_9RHOB|nr:WecB/TagA/CpsF family glycosyltransferase [Albidovulum inexpectatum]PPB80703.1 exopolysaccharide biosynthesis WecB/TagA/CpsF family protein [Albidovulum inexpectatum]